MIQKHLLISTLLLPLVVSACSSAPSPNQVNVNRDGVQVSGTAGSDWTHDELRSNAFGVVCDRPGEKIRNLQLTTNADGSTSFTATCG